MKLQCTWAVATLILSVTLFTYTYVPQNNDQSTHQLLEHPTSLSSKSLSSSTLLVSLLVFLISIVGLAIERYMSSNNKQLYIKVTNADLDEFSDHEQSLLVRKKVSPPTVASQSSSFSLRALPSWVALVIMYLFTIEIIKQSINQWSAIAFLTSCTLLLVVAFTSMTNRPSADWSVLAMMLCGTLAIHGSLSTNDTTGHPSRTLLHQTLMSMSSVLLLSICWVWHHRLVAGTSSVNHSVNQQNVVFAFIALVSELSCIAFYHSFSTLEQSSTSLMSFNIDQILQALLAAYTLVSASWVYKYGDVILCVLSSVFAMSLGLFSRFMFQFFTEPGLTSGQGVMHITSGTFIVALAFCQHVKAREAEQNKYALIDLFGNKLHSSVSKSSVLLVLSGLAATLMLSADQLVSPPVATSSLSRFAIKSLATNPINPLIDNSINQPVYDIMSSAHTDMFVNTQTRAHQMSKVPMFQNFTVDAYLSVDRWPSGINPSQAWAARHPSVKESINPLYNAEQNIADAFHAGAESDRFVDQRNVVISLVTQGVMDEFGKYFEKNDANFVSRMSSHTDWILFYTVWPSDNGARLRNALASLKCHEITGTVNKKTVRDRLQHPAMHYTSSISSIHEYVSPAGAHIITVPIAVQLPAHVTSDIGKLENEQEWLRCCNRTWSIDYALYSGAVFSSVLLRHPILKGYDYYIKMDVDVEWQMPYDRASIFDDMKQQGCVWMHSEYRDWSEDCNLHADEAISHFMQSRLAVKPASEKFEWWKSSHYFYGNFVGGWLGWIRSPENSALAEFLYEDDQWSGYFRYRWGDQPSYIKMLGTWFELDDKEIRGMPRSDDPKQPSKSTVCDYSALRNKKFRHF